MCVLALWTAAVLMLTAILRVRAVVKGRIPRNAFRLGESPAVPDDVAVANRNFMNLLEMPLLFYVVCIALYTTRNVAHGPVVLAWVYVSLRLVHSAVHLTTNRVLQRLVVFAASNFVLLAIWISFMRRVL